MDEADTAPTRDELVAALLASVRPIIEKAHDAGRLIGHEEGRVLGREDALRDLAAILATKAPEAAPEKAPQARWKKKPIRELAVEAVKPGEVVSAQDIEDRTGIPADKIRSTIRSYAGLGRPFLQRVARDQYALPQQNGHVAPQQQDAA
jgi:hypothetical protein